MNIRFASAGIFLAALTSCHRPAAPTGKLVEELQGKPDIVAEAAKPGSPWLAFKLRTFQTNYISGGEGYAPEPEGDKWAGIHTAKITLWDEQTVPVAEIYFREAKQFASPPPRPDEPNGTNAPLPGSGRTYQLQFPNSTMDAILNTLRFSNTDVYLFYYGKQWSIGVDNAESVGSN